MGKIFLHGFSIGTNFRGFCKNYGVDVANGKTLLVHHRVGLDQEFQAGNIFILRIVIRKMLADITQSDRPQQGIANGMHQNIGVPMMLEMIPALKGLWQGDYEHEGEYWQFPASSSVPKPLQKPYPPIWVAARDAGTFNAAVQEGYSVMTWALTRPFSEVEDYMQRFEDALAAAPSVARPRFMTMRHTGVYAKPEEAGVFIEAVQRQGRGAASRLRPRCARERSRRPRHPAPTRRTANADSAIASRQHP